MSRLIADAEELVGYGLYIDLLGPLAAGKHRADFPLGGEEDRCRYALERAAEGRNVALVCSGDAGIYAMGALVFELLDRGAGEGGGVAYGAHIGGFVAGAVIALAYNSIKGAQPAPKPDRFTRYQPGRGPVEPQYREVASAPIDHGGAFEQAVREGRMEAAAAVSEFNEVKNKVAKSRFKWNPSTKQWTKEIHKILIDEGKINYDFEYFIKE